MSVNRKSVFLSDSSLDILGPFSSGRLNGIIEKYGHLIQTQELAALFSPRELALLYQVTKEKATQERESWREFTGRSLEKLLNATKTADRGRLRKRIIKYAKLCEGRSAYFLLAISPPLKDAHEIAAQHPLLFFDLT